MKIGKIIALVAVILIVLLLVPIAVLVSIDLNNYKDRIAQAVENRTGRQLRLQGPIDKSFFPWLGAHIGALQLSNAVGFGDTPMVQLQEVQVRVKLLPLFRKELVIDEVVVRGLRLNLERNAQGVSNWEDLTAQPGKTTIPEQAESGGAKPAAPISKPTAAHIEAVHIGGIDIRDAALVWDDQQAGAVYELSRLNVQTDEVRVGQAFPAAVSFQFNSTQPQAQGSVRLSADIEAHPENQRYGLRKINLQADIAGESLPVAQLALVLSAEAEADLENQTAAVSNLTLASLGSELSGKAQAKQILANPVMDAQLQWRVTDAQAMAKGLQSLLPPTLQAALLKNATLQLDANVSMADHTAQLKSITATLGEMSVQAALQAQHFADNPVVSGSLSVAAFNPRPLLQQLLGNLPSMADDKALTQVALDSRFQGTMVQGDMVQGDMVQGDMASISIKPLTITVDNSKLTGSTAVSGFNDPAFVFALNVDAIDVDRYLPPKEVAKPPKVQANGGLASKPVSSSKEKTVEQDISLPLDLLRSLKVQGELNVGQLKAMQVKLAQLHIKLNARDGVISADPVQAQLYQGSSTTRATLDARQATPRYAIAEQLKGVEFGPLVKDVASDDYLSGLGDIQVNVTTHGNRVSDLKQQLNGSVGFNFANGEVKYLDLADILVADYAKYLRQALPPEDPGKTTAFRILKGTAAITNGVVSNKDLYLQSARFEVHGAGTVDVAKETLDYTANTQIHNPTKQMIKYDLDKLVGIPIPVHFRGTFGNPKYSADWEGALRTVAKQRIKQEQQKLKEKAKQKLQEEEQKFKEKTEQEKQEELRKLQEKLKEKFKKIF